MKIKKEEREFDSVPTGAVDLVSVRLFFENRIVFFVCRAGLL